MAFAIMDGKIAALAVCRVGIRTTGYDALEVFASQALPLGYEGDDRPWLQRGGWCGDNRDRRCGRLDRWFVSAGGPGVVSNARVVMLIQKRVVFVGILTIWVVGVGQVWRCGGRIELRGRVRYCCAGGTEGPDVWAHVWRGRQRWGQVLAAGASDGPALDWRVPYVGGEQIRMLGGQQRVVCGQCLRGLWQQSLQPPCGWS